MSSTIMHQPVRVERTPPLVLAGRNRRFKIGPDPGIKELWASFMTDFGSIEGQIGYRAYGVCHSFDGAGHMDYLCGVEVHDPGQVPHYLYTLTIPARRTAVFIHDGPAEGIAGCWDKIFSEWLPAAKLEVADGPQFEVYRDDFRQGSSETPVSIMIPVRD